MLPVKIYEHNGKYGLMRAEDERHLHRHDNGFLWDTPDEIRKIISDDSFYLLIEDGKSYVEAYRDRWHPDVPIFDELPEGWHFIDGTTTAPNGAKWARNGSFFIRDENGKVCGKNPNYRQAYVLV